MGGNDGVTRNEFGENATSCLDTESERVNIGEDNAGGLFGSRKNTSLDSSTAGNGLIKIRWLLASKVPLEELLNLGDTSRATRRP